MATAPASTPSRSLCVPVSVSQLRCFKTGSAGPTAKSSGVAAAAPRTGDASTTRPVLSVSSFSARTAARERTKSQWSPPASARGTQGSTTNQAASLRRWPCRRHSSYTSPRAIGGWGRSVWVRTGTRLNPEWTNTPSRVCLCDIEALRPVCNCGLSLNVTGTWFMWSWFLTMMESSWENAKEYSWHFNPCD